MQGDKNLDKIVEFHKGIIDQSLEEIKKQAHIDSEQWKYEKLL